MILIPEKKVTIIKKIFFFFVVAFNQISHLLNLRNHHVWLTEKKNSVLLTNSKDVQKGLKIYSYIVA